MNTFTIKDLENLSGIKAHTIRIWEQRYNFLRPNRTGTNIRYYCNEELKTVLNISLLNRYGYKISHIDKMTEDDLRQKIVSLTLSEARQERLVNELIGQMIDLDFGQFEDTLDDHIRLRGIDKTIIQLIFPFLDRIGVLWQSNHIHPVQEHLVTNIIRQKLIAGIESSSTPVQLNKTVLLFLPEGEYHELGLLYVYYLLKNRGVKPIYLGANIPLKDLAFICEHKKPDYLYTHLTCIAGSFHFEKFLETVHRLMPATPFVISGRLARTPLQKVPPAIHLKKSLSEVMEYISNI